MKFISLFFLLAIILIAKVTASSYTGGRPAYRLVADTIIQLDSAKVHKFTKGKKSAPAKSTAIKKDTTKKNQNSLQSEVVSHAEDSTVFDRVNEITYLYGNARVTYEDFELDADFIRVDQKKHLMFARGSIDPLTKKYIGRPISKQGKEKPVLSDSLLFDYKSKRGKIFNPQSDQGGDFLSGGVAKKLNETEVAYSNVLFSTCELPYPDTHFGIVITKGIAEKNRIISGPAYLEIEGIPLPIAIPFGFFPKPDQRASGIILPTFGEDQQLGFYLRGFGYYLGISDYLDLTSTGTIYSKGSYEVNELAHYTERYKYSGTVSLSYGSHNYGLPGDPAAKDFNITWTHTQDPNANPGSTLSASVNAGTSTFYQNNATSIGYNSQALISNTLRSTVNYSRTWEGTPFNLSIGLSHSQDLTNKTVSLQFPTLNFSMASISPFNSKDYVGEPKWYQKITISYNLTVNNGVTSIPEAELFQGNFLLKHLQSTAVHSIPISINLPFLHYFQFTASATYNEHWYLQTIRKNFARGSISGADSLVTDTVNGFRRAGSYALNTGISTKIYSTIFFKKGNVIAIRHVITPNLSFSYNPDFSAPGFGYYKTVVSNATIPYPYTSQTYSVFEDGFPGAGKQASLNLSVDNTIEMKLKPKSTDTAGKDRKVSILDGFTFGTSYNFAADSFKLAPISFSAHTSILNKKVNITFNGSLDPYTTNVRDSIQNGQVIKYAQRVNKYFFQDGKLPQLTNASFSLSGSLNSTSFKPPAPVQPGTTLQNLTPQQTQRLAAINSDPGAYIDFNVPWNLTFNYTFSYNNNFVNTSTSSNLMLSGDLKLTDKWKIQYSTNFDLRALKLSGVPSFSIYRDLHCWDLSASWVPFGFYKSYSVTLKVRSDVLQELKLSKKNDYVNNSNFGQ